MGRNPTPIGPVDMVKRHSTYPTRSLFSGSVKFTTSRSVTKRPSWKNPPLSDASRVLRAGRFGTDGPGSVSLEIVDTDIRARVEVPARLRIGVSTWQVEHFALR